jgi:hypothetical protein
MVFLTTPNDGELVLLTDAKTVKFLSLTTGIEAITMKQPVEQSKT